jgi:hypothetical protein
METIHAFRLRAFSLGIALCTTLLSACAGFGPAPSLELEPPEGWQARQIDRKGMILPPGESLDNFTEFISFKVIRIPFFGSSLPSEWVEGYHEHLAKTQSGGSVSTIREAPDGILFQGVDGGELKGVFVGRILDRNASRFIIKYYVRAPKMMTQSRREKWIDWLLEAYISPRSGTP